MNDKEYDFDDPNIPEDYYDSQEWIDYEQEIQQRYEPTFNLHVPKQQIDHNWQALKQERSQPYVPEPVIERVSNVSLVLWANKNYTDGNLQCDIYKEGRKQPYKKNLIFEVKPELTPRQYKVWDLLITMCQIDLKDCRARRAKIFDPGHAENYSAEFAYFEIWQKEELVWACLLVEDWLLEMRIILDEYQQKGDYRMTSAWKNRISIDQWYEKNI
jgi:hypothetical protein